ncbi:unnamed protein product [Bursaphelenchus xylophilus]|uniref:(pine wood nematode) hypothetical protein n=1 Tax=Bursaphelenchus xylophilus TaxID=6326 RepID=A0A1I7SRZ7_BURXY|nr:unnamed protein product [Bursaphelenchus xylophilus]CAG9105875.1 unnamed protein product [Bursaphelenchus xylophilus]
MNSSKPKSKSKSSATQEKSQPSVAPSLSSDFPGLLQIEALMKEAGVSEWDRGVSFQVHDMAVQMIKSIIKNAEAIKEHREGKAVEDEDLDVAIESFHDSFTTAPVIDGSDPLFNNVQIVNNKALPPVRTDYGYHLPTERFLQVQPDFEVNDDVYEESLKNALASSYETTFPPPPPKRPHMDTTVQQVQHVQRTIQRAPPSESTGTFRITLSSGPSTASAAPSGYSAPPQNQQYVQIESQVHHEAVSAEMEGRLVQQSLSETEETTMLSAFQSESQQNNDFD